VRLPGPAPAGTRLEDLASGTAIANAAQAAIAEGTVPDLARLTGTGAPTARDAADAASLSEHIVIGGGVSRAGTVFWSRLREAVTASLQLDQIEPPPIAPATLSDDAGLYGAVQGFLGNHQQMTPEE
jgi:predicted NBD/HSP70 family sugar kinase